MEGAAVGHVSEECSAGGPTLIKVWPAEMESDALPRSGSGKVMWRAWQEAEAAAA